MRTYSSKEDLEGNKIHTNDSMRESLLSNQKGEDPSIVFSTDKKVHGRSLLNGTPVSLMATNISSLMAGRANLWEDSKDKLGIKDPYGKSYTKANRP